MQMYPKSSSTEHLATPSPKSWCSSAMDKWWKLVSLLALVLGIIALILAIVAEDRMQNMNNYTKQRLLQYGKFPSSCRYVTGGSKVYQIQPGDTSTAFYTYCYVEPNGEKWTLIAAVHENNIDGKCTKGDKWSSEQGPSTQLYFGSRSWENKNVFGRIDALTSQDFKNPAYFNLNASDVMIWHVPNDVMMTEMSHRAFFKYKTSNGFLRHYGSTLQSLYANHAPIRMAEGVMKPLIAKLNSTNVTAGIPQWYSYKYDGSGKSRNRISDGGKDMYDGGNKVFFRIDTTNFTQMDYDRTYLLSSEGIEVTSAMIYPFVAFAWISDTNDKLKYFDFRVQSNYGADGDGNYSTYDSGSIVRGVMTAKYRAYNVFNARDPSICEVFFYIGSNDWGTQFPNSMNALKWSNTTQSADNRVRFNGTMKNVLLGYTLLSRYNGTGPRVTRAQLESVITKYMEISEKLKFNISRPNVVAPVEFVKGDRKSILRGIPTDQNATVDPGYIQFRAHNIMGFANAFCPGVKTTSNHPEQFCLGGMSTQSKYSGQCGDYSGWGGPDGNVRQQNEPTAQGRSIRDIQSTILIFTK